ncbi:MAG: hypothetical protein AAGB32_02815 [Pseudomonadota bacterium]
MTSIDTPAHDDFFQKSFHVRGIIATGRLGKAFAIAVAAGTALDGSGQIYDLCAGFYGLMSFATAGMTSLIDREKKGELPSFEKPNTVKGSVKAITSLASEFVKELNPLRGYAAAIRQRSFSAFVR